MTLIVPPGFANASYVFTSDTGTQPFVTTIGVDISAYSGDHVSAANACFTAWSSTMQSSTDSALTLDRVSLAIGQDGPSGSVDSDFSPSAMTRTANGVPMAGCAIARKVTSEIGRRGRGRMFLPGSLNNGEVDEGGNVSSARVTSLNTALDAFYDALVAGPVTFDPVPPYLFHSQAPTDPTPIEGLAVAQLMGWIRGRIR